MCNMKFPPEIFIAIFSLLLPRDLPSVIRLSTAFRDIGRLLLYRSVDLRSDDIHIRSTVLLLEDANLCKNIQHATLTTRRQSSPTTYSWIPANLLTGWDNLRSLKMIGVPFRTIEAQEVFRDSLIHSCTSLAHFTYRPGADAFPGFDFGISNLTRLSWQTEQETPLVETQIISVMKSSTTTLTHISFTGHLSLFQPTCYYDFLDLRFPLLTSLELGSLFNTFSQEQSDTAITRFIIAHPSIHHLSLGKSAKGPTSFQFDRNRLDEDCLPHLRSFEGFPQNITLLAQCHVRSLVELTTLSLFSDLDNSSLETMFEMVKTRVQVGPIGYGHFPYVRNLRFEFHTDLSHWMESHLSVITHRRWVDKLSEICPSVVHWYGSLLGPVLNPDQLADIFRPYEHLETINVPRLCLNLDIPANDSGINSYFRTIAEKSPMLRQVVARKPAYTELEDCVFCLRRTPSGDFDSVYVRHRDRCDSEDTTTMWSLEEWV